MNDIMSIANLVNITFFRLIWLCHSVFTILLIAKLNGVRFTELKYQGTFKKIYYKLTFLTNDNFDYGRFSLHKIKFLVTFLILLGWLLFAISIIYMIQSNQSKAIYTIPPGTVLWIIFGLLGLLIGFYHLIGGYLFLCTLESVANIFFKRAKNPFHFSGGWMLYTKAKGKDAVLIGYSKLQEINLYFIKVNLLGYLIYFFNKYISIN